ncbi:MAG: hypothetical protein N2255_04170 [Kiritimatiellae bacterium]|nr:hypothetical protein [Kiritimatiellia bacterium]
MDEKVIAIEASRRRHDYLFDQVVFDEFLADAVFGVGAPGAPVIGFDLLALCLKQNITVMGEVKVALRHQSAGAVDHVTDTTAGHTRDNSVVFVVLSPGRLEPFFLP